MGAVRRQADDVFVATKMGRRVAQSLVNYNRGQLRGLEPALTREPGDGAARLVQLHCPPDRGLRGQRCVRGPRRDGRSAASSPPMACRSRPARRRSKRSSAPTSPPCRSSSTAFASGRSTRCSPRRARPGWGSSPACRWPPACLRALRREHDLRRRRPPQLQPPRGNFDVGETFSGVPFEVGLKAVGELNELARGGPAAGPVRAALGHRPAGREHRHPWRAEPRAGAANAAAASADPLTQASSTACARSTTGSSPARSRPLVVRATPNGPLPDLRLRSGVAGSCAAGGVARGAGELTPRALLGAHDAGGIAHEQRPEDARTRPASAAAAPSADGTSTPSTGRRRPAPGPTTPSSPATRATALLTAEAIPAWLGSTPASTVAVSGATVIDRPSANTSSAGSRSVRTTGGPNAQHQQHPGGAKSGPAPMKNRGP